MQYLAGDARHAIAGRHFDGALLIHVLEHVDDPDSFLRLMGDGADLLIIEVPNFEIDPLNAVRHALARRYYTDADHVREHTPAILRDELVRNGFQIVHFEERRGSLVPVARRSL